LGKNEIDIFLFFIYYCESVIDDRGYSSADERISNAQRYFIIISGYGVELTKINDA